MGHMGNPQKIYGKSGKSMEPIWEICGKTLQHMGTIWGIFGNIFGKICGEIFGEIFGKIYGKSLGKPTENISKSMEKLGFP